MGIEIITTVLTPATATPPANALDLVTLADIKAELGFTDTANDTLLSKYITQASVLISQYCDRVFQVQGYQDQIWIEQDPYPYQTPGGFDPLQLKNWPIVPATAAFSFTANTYLNSTTVDTIASTAQPILAFLAQAGISGPGIPAGALIQSVTTDQATGTLAQSFTLSKPATAAGSGVTLTLPLSVIQNTLPGTPNTLSGPSTLLTNYEIDAERGWLLYIDQFSGANTTWPALPLTVLYSAGFASIPIDLQMACERLVTARWYARGRDPMQMQTAEPGIGTERFWIPQHEGSMPPEIEAIVRPYRMPVAL